MGKSNKQHLEDAWKEFERTGEICNAASGLLDYATVLVEINRLQSEECKQLAEDNAKLRESISLVNIANNMSNITGWKELLESMK